MQVFGICNPDDCPTACALGKYPVCPDPIGTGGDWFVAFSETKAPQRKKVDEVHEKQDVQNVLISCAIYMYVTGCKLSSLSK